MSKLEEAIEKLKEYEEVATRLADNARRVVYLLNDLNRIDSLKQDASYHQTIADYLGNLVWDVENCGEPLGDDSSQGYQAVEDAVKSAFRNLTHKTLKTHPWSGAS